MFDSFITPACAAAAPLCVLDEMLVGVFDRIWPFIGFAVFGMFLYGGAMWLISSGDPEKVNKAVGTMMWAFIGTVILAMLMIIMGTFEDILGIPQGQLRVFDIDCVRIVVGV